MYRVIVLFSVVLWLTDKVQLKVYIEKRINDALWKLIRAKYHSTYGALSEEVQSAIVHWLNQHEATITQKRTNPSMPRAHRIAQDIIFCLKDWGFTTQCAYRDLRKAIEKTRGMDIRTVRKWIKFLVRNGYIKQLRTYVYEIL